MICVSIVTHKNNRALFLPSTWHLKELIKSIPGVRYDSAREGWLFSLSWGSLVTLRGVFREQVEFTPEVISWAWTERNTRVDPMMDLRGRPELPEHLQTLEFDERLFPFQRAGAQFLVTSGDTLLADEMGTGKTIQVLAALQALTNAGEDVLPAIVVCPNSVKGHWEREIKAWFPSARPIVISGSTVNKRKLFTGPVRLSSSPFVIMNFEAMRMHARLTPYGSTSLRRCRKCDKIFGEEGLTAARCEVHPKELDEIPFKTVIIDEAHRIKDPHSKQTRACWSTLHKPEVRRRWGLTGTPIANHPGDLWSIMHGLSPDEYATRTKFIDRYCLTGWDAGGGVNIIGVHPNTRDELYMFLDPRFRRMPKALVLPQLPPKVRVTRVVEMSPKQSKAYGQLRDQFLTMLNDGNILSVVDHLSRRVRLMQLASSYANVTYDVEGDWTTMHVDLCEPSPKLDEVEVILDELGDSSVVITAEHRKLIALLEARLTKKKVPFSLIVGGMSTWDRERSLEDFQCGRTKILLMTMKAGGTGLTMTAADTIVFIQRSDSMIDNKQAEDRVHRIGSEGHESITIIDVITRDTVEVKQVELINEKLLRLDEITRDRIVYEANGLDTSDLLREESDILRFNLGTVKS